MSAMTRWHSIQFRCAHEAEADLERQGGTTARVWRRLAATAPVCPLRIEYRTSLHIAEGSALCRYCSLMSQGAATLILSGGALPLGACVLCVLDGT